jgi:FRG domain
MWGQWYGTDDVGTVRVLVNIDKLTPNRGRVHIVEGGNEGKPPLLQSALFSITEGKVSVARVEFTHHPTAPGLAGMFTFQEIAQDVISGHFASRLGVGSELTLSRIDNYTLPSIAYGVNNWGQLRTIFDGMNLSTTIFRGQSNKEWPLESKFHRLGRRDLTTYVERDVKHLARLFAADGRRLDIGKGPELATLIHLGQHHGFPTPWLEDAVAIRRAVLRHVHTA